MLDYLEQREGKDFELKQQEIRLENGDLVMALVAIYSGKNLLSGRSVAELVTMARAAEGKLWIVHRLCEEHRGESVRVGNR